MEFKRGQVLIFDKKGWNDWAGYFLAWRQGDTSKTHAASISCADPKYLWTTGAYKRLTWKPPFVEFCYGKVLANDYIKDRAFTVAECIDPLTEAEMVTVESYHLKFNGMPYGLDKLFHILSMSDKGVFIASQSEPPNTPDQVKNPFCSEAVSAPLWAVGRFVCQLLGKTSVDAITPENLDVAMRYGIVIRRADNQPGVK